MCNRVRGHKNTIILAALLMTLLLIPFITYNGGAAPSAPNNSAITSDGMSVMSWPPPDVEIEDFNTIDGINTNRERLLLRDETNNGVTSGVTIRQKIEMKTDNSIHMATGDVYSDIEMSMDDNEIKVSNEGKHIEVTINHIKMGLETSMSGMILMDMHYDSDDKSNVLDPSLAPLAEILGHTTIIELDDNGNVVQASEHEELLKAMQSGENADMMEQFSSQSQFDQISRMAKALPQGELVGPGDDWDFDMEIDSAFSGSATLLGYKDYDNSDCAIVKLDGAINFDHDQIDAINNAMSENMSQEDKDQFDQIMGDVDIKDGKMSAILYWDFEHQIARYSKTLVTMTVIMDNPMDPSGKLEVPTEEAIIVYSSIVE